MYIAEQQQCKPSAPPRRGDTLSGQLGAVYLRPAFRYSIQPGGYRVRRCAPGRHGHAARTNDGTPGGRMPVPLQQRRVFPSHYVVSANRYSVEQAAGEPDGPARENAVEKLVPEEAARLSRVRNIGIAVGYGSGH